MTSLQWLRVPLLKEPIKSNAETVFRMYLRQYANIKEFHGFVGDDVCIDHVSFGMLFNLWYNENLSLCNFNLIICNVPLYAHYMKCDSYNLNMSFRFKYCRSGSNEVLFFEVPVYVLAILSGSYETVQNVLIVMEGCSERFSSVNTEVGTALVEIRLKWLGFLSFLARSRAFPRYPKESFLLISSYIGESRSFSVIIVGPGRRRNGCHYAERGMLRLAVLPRSATREGVFVRVKQQYLESCFFSGCGVQGGAF